MFKEERPRRFTSEFGNVETPMALTRAILVKYGQQQLNCSKVQKRKVGAAVEIASRAALLEKFCCKESREIEHYLQ